MYKLDPTWLPFSNLMLLHIYDVLLICSDYDRFLLEEDGRVEEELYLEYTQLGLSNPPKITHTDNVEDAFSLITSHSYDLVITMLDLMDEPIGELCSKIKKLKPEMPVIALSPSPSHKRNKFVKALGTRNIDYFFYWQGDPKIFLAMVKLVEDRMNLRHDTSVADVQVIILVEDSIRFYSSFLPMMYTCLIEETNSTILEALNNWGKHLRMRGRPKILLARTYEEAHDLYTQYKSHVLGIISDISYSRGGVKDPNAGLFLAREIHGESPHIPFLLQSIDASRERDAREVGVSFMWKLSPTLLGSLKSFMTTHYGFGPFIFRDPNSGREIARADSMKELQSVLPTIPDDCFTAHSNHNDFSRWLRAQGLFQLSRTIRDIHIGQNGSEETRHLITETIRNYRTNRAKGVISQFSRDNYDETLFFSRIGSGSLGGKGRGLAFIDKELRASGLIDTYPGIYLSIPRTVVISTDQFTRFLDDNALRPVVTRPLDDGEILRLFLSCPLQETLVEDLKTILSVIRHPISVRSSSLLEDSHFQPFAGVYETCMIPNTGDDEERLRELSSAVRFVWASTYFRRAREYMKATEHMVEEEKMAVIIQQVIGSRYGRYFYPNISGVARSLNYYPLGGEKTGDGVGMLAMGLGKTIVDNGSALRFSPAHPRRPAQFIGGAGGRGQTQFYALSLDKSYKPLSSHGENLTLLDISYAEKYPESLRYVASTYDEESGSFTESVMAEGEKSITFNGILKYNAFPLAPIVRDILAIGSEAMGSPVEIEFAVNLNRPKPKLPEFSLLQIRPIAEGSEASDVTITEEERKRAFVHSTMVMGNGNIQDIRDVVCIREETFNQSAMGLMARELDRLNGAIGREYLLIVAGRLGSCDSWLGIPVTWSQISSTRVIVETGLKNFQVEPSQGTHFFQNMTSLGCLYMTVNPSFGSGSLDLGKLKRCPVVGETEHFLHYRTEKPLVIKANGQKGEGVITLS